MESLLGYPIMGFSCWLLFTLVFFVKYMFLAKAKRKGMDEKENMTIWAKKVGHNRGPQNNHTIGDQGGSWTTPLKNCLGAMF